MMYTTAAPFALTGPVIAGHLISKFGYNFVTVQCWSGGCLFFSAFCMAMAVVYDVPEGLERSETVEPVLPRARLGSLVPSFWSRKEEM